MTMYEQAEKINVDLSNLFNSLPIEQFTLTQREEILNILIRFGNIAKFRCRSNVAYENFVNSCFKNIANTKQVKINDDSDFTILKAFIGEEKCL